MGTEHHPHDFKLIAIRPLKGCDSRYLKNLKEGQIYKFYNDYEFELDDTKENVISINHKPTVPDNLFCIKTPIKEIPINISAVVGKNGSGKSSLMEIFYRVVYMIGIKLKIIPLNEDTIGQKLSELQKNGSGRKDRKVLEQFLEEIITMKKTLLADVYYSTGNDIYCLRLNGVEKDRITVGYLLKARNYQTISILSDEIYKLDKFFYSIVINYSIHGLNSLHTGKWLDSLFHKNDGYQTPIVLNPWRREGNIEINTENHLAQSRLLVNQILCDDLPITNGKLMAALELTFNPIKVEDINNIRFSTVYRQFKEQYGFKDDRVVFKTIYESVYEIKLEDFNHYEVLHFKKLTAYIVKKLFKISSRYTDYQKYYEPGFTEETKYHRIQDLPSFLKKLAGDRSHVTLKLRQALNIVRFNLLNFKDIPWKKNTIIIPKKQLIKAISDNHSVSKIPLIELVPACFYRPEILVPNNNNNGDSMFIELSSGETQFAHSIQSILYHIANVNSVFSSQESLEANKVTKEKRYYNYINLVLDEIELYFHPELQRKFIHELLTAISKYKFDKIESVNIILLTHSPFVLSDIPAANILRLKEGKVEEYEVSEQSFGANIHDLLKNSFFLENGSMGEFAKEKISETIDYLNLQIHKKKQPKTNNGNNTENDIVLKEWKQELQRLNAKVGNNTNHDYHERVVNMIGYYHEPDPSIIIQIDHPKLMSASIPERVSFRL